MMRTGRHEAGRSHDLMYTFCITFYSDLLSDKTHGYLSALSIISEARELLVRVLYHNRVQLENPKRLIDRNLMTLYLAIAS